MTAGISLACFSSEIFNPAYGVETPEKLSSDQRIEVVPYETYNVVPITGSVFTATQIIFGEGEFIQDIQNGDLGAWTTSVNKTSPNMLFIKPTVSGSDTNMTVVTNQHTYYFHLNSFDSSLTSSLNTSLNKSSGLTYAIRFIYPEDQKNLLEKNLLIHAQQKETEISAFKNPGNYHWDYSFSGDKTLVPLHVFDDGQFTYFQLRPNQPIPAVFAVNSQKGEEAVVNYRRDDQGSLVYLVIPEIAPQWTLRNGPEHIASIFNNPEIKKNRGY